MKKSLKVLIIFASLIVFLCLFTVAFQWYFNPSRMPEERKSKLVQHQIELMEKYATNPQESAREIINEVLPRLQNDDAAKYYLEAYLALPDLPLRDPMWDRLESVADKGWQESDPELEDFLRKNQPALDLIREGSRQKYCSMPEEQTFLSFSDLLIRQLFVAEAKLYESRKEFDKAGENYIDILRWASKISSAGTIVSTLSSQGMESTAFQAMDSYLTNLQDEKVCQRLLDQLIALEDRRTPLHDMFESEFLELQRALKRTPEDALYYKRPTEIPNIIDTFLDTAQRAGGYVWTRLTLPWQQRELENLSHFFLTESQKSYPEIFGGKLEERAPKRGYSEIIVPSICKAVLNAATADVSRRANVTEVALRLFYLRNGKYPETLEELSSMVPDFFLTDPFSTKHFIYTKTDKGYRLYSIGPNLRDDSGEIGRFPYMSGDIVFGVPNPGC